MAVAKVRLEARNAMLQALLDRLDAGAGNCIVEIYDNTAPGMPTSPSVAVTTQVKLATITASDPAGSVTGGTLGFGTFTQDSSADASGTAAWARIIAPSGSAEIDCDVTDTAGNGSLKLSTTSIVLGGPVQITSLAVTLGGA